tara:strand:- start:77942 stop:78799 length:858 start_codon:yes stop_codon:yes gene_type:complete
MKILDLGFKLDRNEIVRESPDIKACSNQQIYPPALTLKNVTVSYGQKIAIENASLSASAGAITVLVGPSGCGKSSLLASINRLTDTFTNCNVKGDIHIGLKSVLDPDSNLYQLRRRVGMVFQQPNPFPLSIEENISFPLREHGERDGKIIRQKIISALQSVGLWDEVKDRLNTSALKLSGGQQQRLCIARCIALEPDVILFDEPCSALDPISASKVEALIKSFKGRYTIIMVTHNLAQARRIADHVAMCWVQEDCGCIIESGDAKSVLEHSIHPVTQAFCQGLQG